MILACVPCYLSPQRCRAVVEKQHLATETRRKARSSSRFSSSVVASVLAAHLMALEETMAGSNHFTLTIRQGNYLADIVTDRLNPGSAYHYVVQARGSFDVLSWGVERTPEQAVSRSGSVHGRDCGQTEYLQRRRLI